MNGTIDIDTIAHAGADYPALTQLLGGCYHQDWREDHASPDAALQAFVRDASAETVATAASEIDRLLSAGFDAAFSSAAWWDGRASWFIEEHELLRGIGSVVGSPEAPFGPRLVRRLESATERQSSYRHMLLRAAATG